MWKWKRIQKDFMESVSQPIQQFDTLIYELLPVPAALVYWTTFSTTEEWRNTDMFVAHYTVINYNYLQCLSLSTVVL